MSGMFIAELAELLQLYAVRMVSLIFGGRIVPLFAIHTGQSNNYPHNTHLPSQPIRKPFISKQKLPNM